MLNNVLMLNLQNLIFLINMNNFMYLHKTNNWRLINFTKNIKYQLMNCLIGFKCMKILTLGLNLRNN